MCLFPHLFGRRNRAQVNILEMSVGLYGNNSTSTASEAQMYFREEVGGDKWSAKCWNGASPSTLCTIYRSNYGTSSLNFLPVWREMWDISYANIKEMRINEKAVSNFKVSKWYCFSAGRSSPTIGSVISVAFSSYMLVWLRLNATTSSSASGRSLTTVQFSFM